MTSHDTLCQFGSAPMSCYSSWAFGFHQEPRKYMPKRPPGQPRGRPMLVRFLEESRRADPCLRHLRGVTATFRMLYVFVVIDALSSSASSRRVRPDRVQRLPPIRTRRPDEDRVAKARSPNRSFKTSRMQDDVPSSDRMLRKRTHFRTRAAVRRRTSCPVARAQARAPKSSIARSTGSVSPRHHQ